MPTDKVKGHIILPFSIKLNGLLSMKEDTLYIPPCLPLMQGCCCSPFQTDRLGDWYVPCVFLLGLLTCLQSSRLAAVHQRRLSIHFSADCCSALVVVILGQISCSLVTLSVLCFRICLPVCSLPACHLQLTPLSLSGRLHYDLCHSFCLPDRHQIKTLWCTVSTEMMLNQHCVNWV